MSTLIGVGARLAEVRLEALWFDGQSADPSRLTLRADDRMAAFIADDGPRFDYADLRALRGQAGGEQLILRLASDRQQRLMVTDPEGIRLIRTRAKDLDRPAPVPGLWRLWAWGAAAIASVALIIFALIPLLADQLAGYLPPEGERALGEATFEQIRQALDDTGMQGLQTCDAPEGRAALGALQARLTGNAALLTELTVHVLDAPLVNAFALPGGIVVVFDGLIREAGRPEEIAAVLAHEIGHVEARDPTRIALRSAGSIGVLGLLLGDFAGGAAVLFLAEMVIRADYTQEAEAAADAYAHERLLAAGLPPDGIATLFERLSDGRDEPAGLVRHFAAHPALGDRIEAARAAMPPNAEFAPALTEAEWQALRSICD